MFFIIIILIIIVGLWFVVSYNGFVALINRAKEAWSDIDIQLKRRYDLIPNLVNTVKGYAAHEKDTFENISAARSAAMGTQNIADKAKAEDQLTGALGKLFAVAEANPELKANENFLSLQNELSDTENKIQAARRFYNGNVRDLNTKIESVPSNIIASLFHFEKMTLFQLDASDAAAKNPVEVSF